MKIAFVKMIKNTPETTADVVYLPTDSAPLVTCIPLKQPMDAIRNPKIIDLTTPPATSIKVRSVFKLFVRFCDTCIA